MNRTIVAFCLTAIAATCAYIANGLIAFWAGPQVGGAIYYLGLFLLPAFVAWFAASWAKVRIYSVFAISLIVPVVYIFGNFSVWWYFAFQKICSLCPNGAAYTKFGSPCPPPMPPELMCGQFPIHTFLNLLVSTSTYEVIALALVGACIGFALFRNRRGTYVPTVP